MSISYWWERLAYSCAALERNPADKLAYRELRLLGRVKDNLITQYGEGITVMMDALMEASLPQ